ncbi:MAG: hypothetical protein HYY25_17320 [Candidatus Wallbacteria bacterium]|nr:hypothetical protein [Candidatus Wallbacteria bacterium]
MLTGCSTRSSPASGLAITRTWKAAADEESWPSWTVSPTVKVPGLVAARLASALAPSAAATGTASSPAVEKAAVHRYVNGSPSGSLEPRASSTTALPATTSRSPPASAVGGRLEGAVRNCTMLE